MANRVCYYTNESFYDRPQQGYFVAKVTENEAGYVQTEGLHKTSADATLVAERYNAALNLSRDDVLEIVASSMRQGSVRD
jgi:hypothetical protein